MAGTRRHRAGSGRVPVRTRTRTPGRTPSWALTLALALALALALSASAGADGPSITGTLTDEEDRPLAGAEVTLHGLPAQAARGALYIRGTAYPEPRARDVTDADGRFRLEAPEAGFWTLVARAEGRAPMEHPLWPLLASRELEPVALPPDVGLDVRVVDGEGRPILGAVVEGRGRGPSRGAWFRRSGLWRPLTRRLAAAGDDGRLRLPRHEGETVILRAVAPGRPPVGEAVEPQGEGPVRMVLPAGPTRRVRVLAPDGDAVPDAVVWFAAPIPAGLTDAEGILEVALAPGDSPDDPAEPMAIQVDSPDGLAAETELQPLDEGEDPRTPVRVHLTEPSYASGRVLEAGTGDGRAGALVWLRRDPAAAVRADRTGSFRIAVRGPWERARLRAVAAGFLRAGSELPGESAGEGGEVTLVLEPAVTLAGVVVDARGHAVPGAAVRVARRPGPGPRRSTSPAFARSGADGRFRVAGLAADASHVLHVERDGYAPALETVPPAAAGSGRGAPGRPPEVRVVLEADRSVRGRVVSQAGEPVAGARVVVIPGQALGRWPGVPPGLAETSTTEDGTFELDGMLAGRPVIVVSAEGYAPLQEEGVELPESGGATDLGDLVLEPEAFVTGRVEDPEGIPIGGASVLVSRRGGSARHWRTPVGPAGGDEPVTTAADGRFRMGGLAGGSTVDLRVRKEGYVSVSLDGVPVPGDEPLAVILEPEATVSGTVVDIRGAPVADARVIATRRGVMGLSHHVRPAQTDAEGAFELGGLSAGAIALEARASGFRTSPRINLELSRGEHREGVEIVLERGFVVDGRVLGPEGAPVAGARVAVRTDDSWGGSTTRSLARTGADGGFSLDGLAPGRMVIEARKEGFTKASEAIDLGPGGASVELFLGRGTEVSGRVVGPDGAPAAGRDLQLVTGTMVFDGTRQVTTTAEGTFRFEGVPEGLYRLAVIEDHAPVWTAPDPVRVERGVPVTGVEVRLPETALVRGRIVGLEPRELRRASVDALLQDGSNRGRRRGVVEDHGRFRISGLAPGVWTVLAATESGGRGAREQVTIEPGQREASVTLEFLEGHTVTGTVLSEGRPAASARLRLASAELGGSRGTTSDGSGSFRFEGVPPGRHVLIAQHDATGATARRQVEVAGDRELRIDLSASRVRGTVYTADGSGAVEGAAVRLQRVPSEGEGWSGMGFPPSRAVTGADGTFLLSGVEEGRWRLLVEKSGYAAHTAEIEVPGAGEIEAPPVFLEPTGAVEIVARLADGRAPSRLFVMVIGDGSRTLAARSVTPIESGRFVLDTIPPGSWTLVLQTPEAPRLRTEIEVPGRVELTFPEPCTLEVLVPELAADGSAGRVTVLDPSGGMPQGVSATQSARLSGGRAELSNLAPGAWAVTAASEDGRTWSETVTVAPGPPTRVVLE